MDARRGPCDELRYLPIFVIDRVPALPLVRRVAQQGIAKLPEAARCARPPLAGPRAYAARTVDWQHYGALTSHVAHEVRVCSLTSRAVAVGSFSK